MWQIRPATEHDAASLAELGESTFRETYRESRSSDVDLYCARCYSPALQRRELRDPTWFTRFYENLGFRPGGEGLFMLGNERQRDLVMTAQLTDLHLTPLPTC